MLVMQLELIYHIWKHGPGGGAGLQNYPFYSLTATSSLSSLGTETKSESSLGPCCPGPGSMCACIPPTWLPTIPATCSFRRAPRMELMEAQAGHGVRRTTDRCERRYAH